MFAAASLNGVIGHAAQTGETFVAGEGELAARRQDEGEGHARGGQDREQLLVAENLAGKAGREAVAAPELRVLGLMSHLGRPEEGVYSEENSLQPVVASVTMTL